MRAKTPPPPDECAVCGAAIPRGAKACPECGADERTGWREQDACDGLDLPDSAFEDDDTPRRTRRVATVNGVPWYWIAVGAGLALLLILTALRLR